jgi:hypothetical protein
MQEEREKQAQLRGAPAIDPDHAAAKIQKVWKGYAQRKRTKQLREEEFEFIGMVGLRTSCFVKYCVVFLRRCSPSVSTPVVHTHQAEIYHHDCRNRTCDL